MKLFLNIFIPYIFLCTLLSSEPLSAQTGTVRINGGGPQFIFTSYNQFSTGITLTSWNKVRINYTFAAPNLNWQLRVRSDYPAIMSADGGNPNINNLTYLKITVNGIPSITPVGSTTCIVNGGFFVDNLTPQVLVSGTGTSNFEVILDISYSFGVPAPSLINVPWGFYYTNLTFILEYF